MVQCGSSSGNVRVCCVCSPTIPIVKPEYPWSNTRRNVATKHIHDAWGGQADDADLLSILDNFSVLIFVSVWQILLSLLSPEICLLRYKLNLSLYH